MQNVQVHNKFNKHITSVNMTLHSMTFFVLMIVLYTDQDSTEITFIHCLSIYAVSACICDILACDDISKMLARCELLLRMVRLAALGKEMYWPIVSIPASNLELGCISKLTVSSGRHRPCCQSKEILCKLLANSLKRKKSQ